MRVLVATDLSLHADEAIRQGDAYARDNRAELIVCHVMPSQLRSDPLFPQANQSGAVLPLQIQLIALLRRRVTELTGRRPTAFTALVEEGAAAEAILRWADDSDPALIVIGSHGHPGFFARLLGGIAERMVRGAHCPLLVAREHPRTGRILVATDFSNPELPAVAAAATECRRRGARMTVLHRLDPATPPLALLGVGYQAGPIELATLVNVDPERRNRAQAQLSDALGRFAVDGDTRLAEGDVVQEIVRSATDLNAELLVIGTSGKSGIERLAFGSVAEEVIRAAPCPVLVVRLGHTNSSEKLPSMRQPTLRTPECLAKTDAQSLTGMETEGAPCTNLPVHH